MFALASQAFWSAISPAHAHFSQLPLPPQSQNSPSCSANPPPLFLSMAVQAEYPAPDLATGHGSGLTVMRHSLLRPWLGPPPPEKARRTWAESMSMAGLSP